ncbi:MAG: hypothetical protein GY832_02535 [Chloroflexi bacterium]|nr:hypothetical protein [Chloroflexota bacterium]
MSRRTVFLISLFLLIITILLAACDKTPTLLTRKSPLPAAISFRSPIPTPLGAQIASTADLNNLPPSAPIILNFNQPMNPDSTTSPLHISPVVDGKLIWNKIHTKLVFTPASDLDVGQHYLVYLDQALESAAGSTFARPPQWRVQVMSAPKVLEKQVDTSLNQRRPKIQLRFDRAMDHESVADALDVEPDVPFNMSWDDKILTIEPLEPHIPGTYYHFILRQTATDLYGLALPQEYRWGYHLDGLIEHTVWPVRDGDTSTPLVIRFNYPMNVPSVKRALAIEPAIEGDLTWNDTGTIATITPIAPLPNETEYAIHLDGLLLDAHGDELPPVDPLHFTTPPPILSIRRQGKDTHPNAIIEVIFDRLMDPASTEDAFQVTPALPGSFEWRETTLIFQADSGYLTEYTTYTVTIGTDADGLDGNPILQESYTWSFHTTQFQDLATFGWGPNAQVLDVDGRRAIQFQVSQAHPATLTFELYRLSLNQFLDRYTSGFRGVAGREDRPVSTEGTTLARQWQIETSQSNKQYVNINEVIIPADVPPGLYVLNLNAGHLNDQLILLLTRNTIALKQAEGQIAAWVSNVNGESVRGIEVSVYARDGQLVSQGYTDQNGVYRTAIRRDPQPLIVVARDGSDVTATGLSNEWRSTGSQWWGWWRPAPKALDWATYIYTDRPIYRPGQTVSFKGIVRQDDDAVLGLPAAETPITVRVRDARDNVVQTIELVTNHFGTVDGEFTIAEGAMLGDYAIEIVVNGESHHQAFKVQDYRKPDYQVSVTTDAEKYIAGQEIAVTVDAGYFFGKPLPNARLVIRQYELGERYWWDESSEDPYIWYQSNRSEINGTTDANGHFTFTLDAALGHNSRQVHWRSSLSRSTWGIEVTADDGSRQTVSSFAVVQVFDGAEKVRLNTGGYFKTPDQPFTVRATASTIFDEPASGRSLRLQLRRYDSDTNDYTIVLQSVDLTTDNQGQAALPFTVEEPGYYQLYLSGTDDLGNELSHTSWLYVFGESRRWTRRSSGISIAADRESYAPGDTAQLVIESTWSGPALLTFERGTTRREQLIELTAPLTLVEVPIQPDDAPNIFITVNAWQERNTTLTPDMYVSQPDSQLHTASVELRVPVTDKTLHVVITPDQPTYAPREEATFTVRVTNARGDPVSAEVSLALVDEAIFSLSDDMSGPIHDAFYFERAHIVRTYDGMALRRHLPGGGRGGGGGGDGGLGANPRSDFPDTAAWYPVLYTDSNGEVAITLTLPDSLTSWRLTAKATTADTQVGEAIANVLTQQEIIVRPILPRSLTDGDSVQISAIVHNYGDQARYVKVSIASDLLDIQAPVTQTIRLASGAQRIVGWSATAQEAGEATVTVWAALHLPSRTSAAGQAGDAVQLTLPIRPLAVPDVESQVGAFSGELITKVRLPAEALDLSSVRIELNRSIAGSLFNGLEYLTGYPYGCVEQTMSRALPNAVVGRAFHQLGIGNPTLQADLPPKINAGIQRLYGFQHNDGGWGWWYDDATNDYQTAWVVFGLAVTAEAGHEVDPDVIERGTDWLAEHLDEMDIRTRAYALYSMAVAGHGDLAAAHDLLTDLTELDTFSQAALALALYEMGATDEADEVLDVLVETAVVTENGRVYWPNSDHDGYYHHKTMASTTRSTALALSAFTRIRPGHELESGVVRWLMAHRRRQGWGTTNETSFAILALTDHLLATEFATANTLYSVELNGQVIISGTLGRGEPAVSLEILADQMKRGLNRIRIQQSGEGQLYYVISSQIYLPEAQIEAAGNIQISRTYKDAQTQRRINRVEPGQLVQVHLQVTLPDDGFYIIVEDNLPGGLEPLNENLNTTSHKASVHEDPHYYWQEYGYNHKEIHGDRVSFFITELGKGQHTFSYLARATHEGEFVAMPVEAYAMYDLTTWGRSASNVVTVDAEVRAHGF